MNNNTTSNVSILEEINGSDTLIVSFDDFTINFSNNAINKPFYFQKFLDVNYPQYDKFFYRDIKNKYYHYGIDTISSNIQETTDYLQEKIQKYKKVIFMGSSSGGYAAILFGSLLNVNIIVAFIPQTILYNKELDETYCNLQQHINSTSKYYLFSDPLITLPMSIHNMYHCANIAINDNIIVTEVAGCCNMNKVIEEKLLTIMNDILVNL